MAGSLYCWYGSFTPIGLDLASWRPLLRISANMVMLRIRGDAKVPLDLFYSLSPWLGARVIDIVARYRVFRSLLLPRLACVVYSLMSQSLTVLAVIDGDVTVFFQRRHSVALGWDLLMSYDSLIFCCTPSNSFLHSLSLYQPYKMSQLFL